MTSSAVAPDVSAPAGVEPSDAGGSALHKKLVWLTLFRIVMITVLLGGTAAVNVEVGERASAVVAPLYTVIALTYGASVVFSLLLQRRRALQRVAAAQIALDVGIAGVVVAMTGGADSVFVFMFLLAIVNGGILLDRAGAFAALALAIAAYAVVVLALPHPGVLPRGTLFAHVAAFVATAALAGYLADLLRRTGEKLAASESDLAEVTALNESIVQSVTSGLLTVDPAGRITLLNRAGEQITGLSRERIAGHSAARFFPAFGSKARGEVEFVNASGARRLLGYSAFDLHGRESARSGTAVIFQDLTDLRAMENAMERSKRLADLGQVAAGLAHELRNPLASISGCVELLRGAQGLSAEDQRVLSIVLRETSRLDELLTRFLEFSRPAPPSKRSADLAVIAGETLDVFAGDPSAAGLAIERELAHAPVECDPDQLRQVLWNLLANAAQAMRESGSGTRIRVSCALEPDGGAAAAVEDDGPGIDAADAARIFTPFFTTKASGSGLGLAVVQRIMDAHGGSVSVESAPGRGARFALRLPGPPSDGPAVPR